MQPATRIIIEDDSLDRLFVETGLGVALVPVRPATVQFAMGTTDERDLALAFEDPSTERDEH